MTGREDIAGAVGSAPALLDVYIVSVPDGLLVRSWQRSGERDGEAAAAHVGQIVAAAAEMLGAMDSTGGPEQLTVEAADRLVLVSGVVRGLVAALVFDRGAPLGLVRIEARDLIDRVRASLTPLRPREEPVRPRITPVPPPPDLARGVSAIVAAQAPTQPDLNSAWRMAQSSAPQPVPAPSAPPPIVLPPAARTSAAPSRAGKLIEALREGSADVHTALLRVSLRTGIPVEVLEHPETLQQEQVDVVAAAVRDMLGREPLG